MEEICREEKNFALVIINFFFVCCKEVVLSQHNVGVQ